MKKVAIAIAGSLAVCATVSADQGIPENEHKTWEFHGGVLRVDSVTDAKDPNNVRQYVQISRRGHVIAMINSAGFDTLAASFDESYFVGLSNKGTHGTAVVVFDREGNVELQVGFQVARFDYCARSSLLIRNWHGSTAADVHFEKRNALSAISLLDCRGDRVNLLETVGKALASSGQEYLKWRASKKTAEK